MQRGNNTQRKAGFTELEVSPGIFRRSHSPPTFTHTTVAATNSTVLIDSPAISANLGV